MFATTAKVLWRNSPLAKFPHHMLFNNPLVSFHTLYGIPTYPIIYFIFPALVVFAMVGTVWGSRGPNIPWGRMATVNSPPTPLAAKMI